MTEHVYRFMGERVSPTEWRIQGDELHHLRKVLRLQIGTEVEICDGAGWSGAGTLTEIAASVALVAVARETFTEREMEARFGLAVGALKPSDIDDLIAPLTELGLGRISIFLQAGSDKGRLSERIVERWHRIAEAAVKQCKRAWLPEIRTYANLTELIADHAAERPAGMLVALDPQGVKTLPEAAHSASDKFVTVIIGSEKGLTEGDVSALRATSSQFCRLGRNILRARTAAIAAGAVLSCQD